MSAAVAVAPSLVLSSAVDVCTFIDDLPPDAAGEIVVQGHGAMPEGAVFVEKGRVCWAAARGLARRLSDLLATCAKVDAAGMEALYDACKRERAPLGEYLVKAGLVTPADLRAALLKHTAESLHALCGPGVAAEWIARRSGGYSPRFTFTTTELVARTFAEAHRALADQADAVLEGAFADGEWGAAFVRSPSRALPDPIAVHGAPPERVAALLRLGRWATSSLDVASLGGDEAPFVAAVLEAGARVAWKAGAMIIAGSTSPTGPARLLNRRARARARSREEK